MKLAGDLCHLVVNKTGRLEIDPIQPNSEMKDGLVHTGLIHGFDLLLDIGSHLRRGEELHFPASNTKTVRFMNNLFVLTDMDLWMEVVLLRHPMVMDIDDGILFLHGPPLLIEIIPAWQGLFVAAGRNSQRVDFCEVP